MPANSISHFLQTNQSSAVKRKSDDASSAEAAQSPGAGFESVLRDIRRSRIDQNIAAPSGKKLPTGDLQKFALGPNVKIITPRTPPPDEQSLLDFARAEGIDGALLELIMGKKDASPKSPDSSAPDPLSPSDGLGPIPAISFSALVQAPIGFTADLMHTPIQDPVATTAAAVATAPVAIAPVAIAPVAIAPVAIAAAGAPGTNTLIPTAAASDQGEARLPGSERVAANPFAGVLEPTGTTVPDRSGLPLPSAGAALNSVDTRAMFSSGTPSGRGKPADAPATADGSVTEIPAQPGTDNSVLTDRSGLPQRLAGTTAGDSPSDPVNPGPNRDGQMPVEAAANGDKGSPAQTELLEYEQGQGQEGPAKDTLHEGMANLLRQENQKPGKAKPGGSPGAILRETDAPATAAAQMHWAVGATGDSAGAVTPQNHSQALGAVTQELDLGTAAPAHEESMQDDYFRRSEQYQMLSDRVSEAIGQRLSAQIAKGVWQVNLQLSPRHLGKIDIRLGMRGTGTIDAEFNTSQQSTRDLLLNGLPKLKEVMAQSGLDLSRMDVRHEGASANGGNAHTRQPLPAAAQLVLPDQQVAATQIAPHTARVGADGLDVMV